MNEFTCDLCGKLLLLDDDVRYKVSIEVYAACDPMELTDVDLGRDHELAIDDLCRRLADVDEAELADSVYKEMEFDLCPPCQKLFLADPLSRGRRLPRLRASRN